MHIFHRRAGTKPALHSSGSRRRESRLRPASAVVVEALEKRWLMTTAFNAYFSIPAGTQQASTSGCCIIAQFTTTGGTAYKWDVDWNDNSAHSIFYPNGSQTVFYDHTYADVSHAPYNITATAYPSSTGGGIQAVQALTNTFGTAGTGSHTGMTTDSPSGGSGDLSGKSMVLDDLGRAYVAIPYSGQIAITRFTSQGVPDTTFNGGSATLVLQSFDGGSDSPTSLYFAPITKNGATTKYLAVAGKGANGFAVALLDLTTPMLPAWTAPNSGTLVGASAVANAVYIDRNGDVIAVGTYNRHMVAVKLTGGDSGGALASWGDNNSGIVTVLHWPNGTNTIGEAANAVIEYPSGTVITVNGTQIPVDDLVIGGWERYIYNGCDAACDWAMIALTDAGGAKDSTTSFGCCNLNWAHFANGHSINSCNSLSGFYSTDSINAFTIVWDSDLKIIPVGSTNYNTTIGVEVAVGCFFGVTGTHGTVGTWDHSYGPDGVGLLVGSAGIGYAAVLDSAAGTTVAGKTPTSGNPDFLVNSFNNFGVWNSTFGNNGVFTTNFGSTTANSTDTANGVAYTPDGSAVIAGGFMQPFGSSYGQIALAEYDINNTLQVNHGASAPVRLPLQPTLSGSLIDPTVLPVKRRQRQPLLSG